MRALTVNDIKKAGRNLFKSNPTYVVFGNTKGAYEFSDIQRVFAELNNRFNSP